MKKNILDKKNCFKGQTPERSTSYKVWISNGPEILWQALMNIERKYKMDLARNIEHFSTSNPRKLWNNNRTIESIPEVFSNRKSAKSREKLVFAPFSKDTVRSKNTFTFSITHRLSRQ